MATMKLYVWHPGSLGDHTEGTAVAMASTRAAAIEKLVEAHDDWNSYKSASDSGRETVAQGKARMMAARAAFRKELDAEEP